MLKEHRAGEGETQAMKLGRRFVRAAFGAVFAIELVAATPEVKLSNAPRALGDAGRDPRRPFTEIRDERHALRRTGCADNGRRARHGTRTRIAGLPRAARRLS